MTTRPATPPPDQFRLGSWVQLDDGDIAQVSWPADFETFTIGVLTTEGKIRYPRLETLRQVPEPEDPS